ncbi:MAG: DUF4956 domain-containing protein [Oscillospiraceae bacterium]|jgi:uncharacterized membrane protein|nr:DUF4956 domain-containing protein [Oscillospiraceae bacterium]
MRDRIWELITGSAQFASLDALNIIVTMAISAVCALVIYLVYRFFHKGAVYSPSFALLIVMVCAVTAFIIITIGANLVLSLGMVGALSIVRFRAAVKDPLDVGFLFWSVASGLTAGAQLHLVALMGTAFIALLYILFTLTRSGRHTYLLIVRYGADAEEPVLRSVAPLRPALKNKTLTPDATELTVEIKTRRGDVSFLEQLRRTDGVSDVTLVEYTGDYT